VLGVCTGTLARGLPAALTIAWFRVIIIGTGFVTRWIGSPRVVKVIDVITGTVLVGF